MRALILIFTIVSSTIFTACNITRPEQAKTTTPTPAPAVTATPTASPVPGTVEEAAGKSANLKCQEVNTGDFAVYKKQTFAIDFEPFKGSCFVTSHDPEFDDPPLDSKIAIYKNGKKNYDFPSQFNGVSSGCWVDAVAFQDLNGDKLTDIIVVGKCSAKTTPYNENMVYVNTGKAFTTREDANNLLAEKTTIKAIADFVKENREMFFNN